MPIGYAQLLKRHIYLTNPLAVNFDAYHKKLREAKSIFVRFVEYCIHFSQNHIDIFHVNSEI